MPGWYPLLRAADRLNVSVFELPENPDAYLWIGRALTALHAENLGDEIRLEIMKQRKGMSG